MKDEEIEQLFRVHWEPMSELNGPEWVSEFCELPTDSELKNFDFEMFPLARFVIEQLCHNRELRRFTEMLCAQAGKTTTILAYLRWKIINNPSATGWFTDTDITAKDDKKSKIDPAFETCKPVRDLMPTDRKRNTEHLIQFGFMNLRIAGANSKKGREGKTMAEVLCDEVRNYPPGAMEQIDNRLKTITNPRRVIFSSPGTTTEEPYISFRRGSMHMGFWHCPKCDHRQTFRFGKKKSPLYPEDRKFGGFVWDDIRIGDYYDLPRLLPTVRYECENEACQYRMTEAERVALIPKVQFTQTNPMASPDDISVQAWEAYMPFRGCSGPMIVSKFLNALVAMKQGDIEPMRIFHCETCGEPWEELGEAPSEAEILERRDNYLFLEELWPEEKHTVDTLTVDMQGGFQHSIRRKWTPDRKSRLIDRLQFRDFHDIREYQEAKKIQSHMVGIDCAGERYRAVVRACWDSGERLKGGGMRIVPGGHSWLGWKPLMGDDKLEYSSWIRDAKGQETKIIKYFKPVMVDSAAGQGGYRKPIFVFYWAGNFYKRDLYFSKIKGLSNGWFLPKNIDEVTKGDYVRQMSVCRLRQKTDASGNVIEEVFEDKHGRHDDGDCEAMQLVVVDITRPN